MAVKRDAGAGKYYEGSVFGGEGKQNVKGVSPYEYTGVYKSGPNPKLHQQAGYTSKRDGAEEPGNINRVLGTESYGGPQRAAMKATNLGDRHPDDLQHSS